MKPVSTVFVVTALAVCAASASAQTGYPAKPVRLVVPTPSGGPSDAVARALAKGLSASLGQDVVVENRPGGNTGIGASAVLHAPADGYTLLFALGANVGLPHLSKASPYKSLAEFTPVATMGGNTQCLVVPASLPVKSLADLAAVAKASPRPLLRGSNNTAEDMVAAQVSQALGLAFERVPYKGAPQLLPDLLEGRIQVAVLPVGASLPHVKAGRLTLLGCSMAERFAALPAVPTLAEGGVTAAPPIAAHFVLGPPRLPADIVDRLAVAARQATQSADFRQEMDRLLIVGGFRPPAETRELMAQAEAQIVQFVRETGASID